MQTTLLSLAIAVILALLAALIGPHFVDWNAHRATFEQHASQLVGQPVRVAGKMDVRLLPSPTLLLGGIEIGHPGDPNTLRASGLGIEFALPPLLSGKLRAVEMNVTGPQLQLALDREGRAAVPAALAGLNVEALSIEKLTVEEARIELSDATSGARAVVSKLWFNGAVKALPGPFRGEGAFVLDGGLYGYRIASARPETGGARIKLSLDPSDRPLSAEADGLLAVENGVPRFEGSATIAQRVAKGATAEPWRIAARVKANAAAALFEQVEFQFGPDERALKLTGTAEAAFGARPRLNAVLSARTLDADKMLAGDGAAMTPRMAAGAILAAAAAGFASPPMPLQLGFGIDSVTLGGATVQNLRGDIELRRDGVTLSSFEMRAPGFTQVQASGRLNVDAGGPAFEGPVEVRSVDLRAFAEWAQGRGDAPPLPARPLRLRGDLRLGAGVFAIERLNADIDGKAIEGGFSYTRAHASGGARLQANLRADEFDFDSLMALSGPAKAWPGGERPETVALALSLRRLRLSGLEGERAELRLALDKSGLAIERLSVADIGGVGIESTGRIALQTQSPRGSLAFNLAVRDGAGLATLAERLAGPEASVLRRLAAVAAPATIAGTLSVEAGDSPAASRLALALAGPLGALQLNLQSSIEGEWMNAAAARLAAQVSLRSDDVNTLVGLIAADHWLVLPRRPGSLRLSINGEVGGGLTFDSRVVSDGLDARASGLVHAFGPQARSAALDIAIGKADVVPQGGGMPAQPVPVALTAKARFDAGSARFDNVAATVARSALRGRLGIAFGEPSAIEGDLDAGTLDLVAVLRLLGVTTAAEGRSSADAKTWSEAPFVVPLLPALTGRISVSATRLQLTPTLQAGNLRSVVHFQGSEIGAQALEADLFGGRASADLKLRRGTDGIGLQARLAVRDADAGQLLPGDAAGAVNGRAGLELQLEGAGLSPRALIGSLNGSGKVTLNALRVSALDANAFAAAIRAIEQGLPIDETRVRDVIARALQAGPLSIRDAAASLSLAAGIARIEAFAARAEGADLALTGTYNVPQSSVDFRLTMVGPASGNMALRPDLSILMRGPASAPRRSLDVSSLTGWLALRSVDEQTRRIETIERGQAPDAETPRANEKRPAVREPPRVIPQRRPPPPPVQSQQSAPAAPAAAPRTALQPLPPPIDIKPVPGERRVPARAVSEPRRPPDIRTSPPPPKNASPVF